MRKTTTTRNAEIATIKIAAKQLGMDDGTYRDMLWTIACVRSAKDLDWAGRKKVIDHLKACGAVIRKPGQWDFIKRASADHQPLLRKICAVCLDMKVSKAYAEGVAKRQHGIERRLEMMDATELWKVAAALERTRQSKAKEAANAP